ncbi:MAG TPA: SIMPL domain-containing protein [Gemmatimonadaceae bacterium]|nr:SIMPL domain-containing protein [Gemmatimonadaceae bacterium]
MRLSTFSALAAATLAGAATLRAQQPMMPMQPPPQVITQAQGEVQVTPDRASVTVAVETRGATAAAAAAENARVQTAVLAALRTKLALGNDQLSTMGYSVNPEYDYSQRTPGKPPRIAGYVARNMVRAELRKIDQVGPAIDASLSAGANNIQGVNFWSSTYDQARRQALTNAINKACEDGAAMALAAGGLLGQALEVSSQEMYGGPRPMADMAMSRAAAAPADVPTPIEPGSMSVMVSATVRWRLLEGSGASGGAQAMRCGSASR